MPSVHFSERAKLSALIGAGLAAVVLWAYLLTASPKSEPFTPPPGLSAAGVTTAAPTRVTAVGGAFTAPLISGGEGPNGWPVIVGNRFGWKVATLANDGAGYVTAGEGGFTLPAQLDNIVASRPDIVLLAGGRADVGQQSSSAIAKAAGDMVAAMRQRMPNVRIVVLGPVATDATAPAGATEVRDAVRATVTAVPNTTFVDPLDENWFADAPGGAIAPDGQHPTDIGHRLIADKLGADLIRLGVARG